MAHSYEKTEIPWLAASHVSTSQVAEISILHYIYRYAHNRIRYCQNGMKCRY